MSTAPLKWQFDLQTKLFSNTLDGISETEANVRPSDQTNTIKFIAGHLLNARAGFLTQLTGGQPDGSYNEQFGRNVPFDANATYPGISSIASRWTEVSEGISNALAHMPQEVLDAKAPVQTPVADDTIKGLIAFLMSHEAYHIGQLGLLRKMVGKEAMSYS